MLRSCQLTSSEVPIPSRGFDASLAVAFCRTAVAAGTSRLGRHDAARRSAPSVPPDAPLPQLQLRPPASKIRRQAQRPPAGNRCPRSTSERQISPTTRLNPAVFLHHLIADRIWISGQANFIFQAHEPFHSPYAGTNSFQSRVEMTALSRVLTLYTGIKLTRWTEFIFDAEEAGGKGLSKALGIAAFPNLDVVRNPSLGQGVYAARYFIH